MSQVKTSQSQNVPESKRPKSKRPILFVCLSVCLSVNNITHIYYSHSYERIAMKFYGGVKGILNSQVANFQMSFGITQMVKYLTNLEYPLNARYCTQDI